MFKTETRKQNRDKETKLELKCSLGDLPRMEEFGGHIGPQMVHIVFE